MRLKRRVRTNWTVFWLVAPIFYSLVGVPAHALDGEIPERWGEFTWLSPWIESSFVYQEPRSGGFSMNGASFGGRWAGRARGATWVEAQVAIGTRSLVLRPLRYAPVSTTERQSDPAIVDAFAGVSGDWGRLRLGFIPLVFGLEEGVESERRWQRPLILQRGLMGLRDLGAAYAVAAGGFRVDWIAHNGEGGDDRDREIWMTTRTEYRVRNQTSLWRMGVSGQVGRTTPDSTHPAGTVATATELDADKAARLRIGGAHVRAEWALGDSAIGTGSDRRFGFEIELIGIEAVQDAGSKRLRSMRFDLEWEPTDHWGLQARHETFDPDLQVGGDLMLNASLGVQYYLLSGARKRSLRTLLVGTAEWQEGRANPQHRIDFALRFSPDI